MKTLTSSILALALLSAAPVALSQAYPNKPIRLVVGITPGSAPDIIARLLGQKLTEYLGQQVFVDNRPGAGSNIANAHVAKSPPDGYTLLLTTASVAINMSLYENPGFDTLRDFAAVSIFATSPVIMVVHDSVPVKNVKEVITLAQAKPGALNFSSAGSGTTPHLAGELFKVRTKTDIVHIPYKGGAPATAALLGGEVSLSFSSIPTVASHIKSGRLRPLATLGLKRTALLLDVPTMKEAGVDGIEDVVVWFGVLAPAKTPREVINTLAAAIQKAAQAPDVRQRLRDLGAEPVGNTPEEFGKQLREEIPRWAELVRVSGAKAED